MQSLLSVTVFFDVYTYVYIIIYIYNIFFQNNKYIYIYHIYIIYIYINSVQKASNINSIYISGAVVVVQMSLS